MAAAAVGSEIPAGGWRCLSRFLSLLLFLYFYFSIFLVFTLCLLDDVILGAAPHQRASSKQQLLLCIVPAAGLPWRAVRMHGCVVVRAT